MSYERASGVDYVNDTGAELVFTARISDEGTATYRDFYVDGVEVASVKPNMQNTGNDGDDRKQLIVHVPAGATYRHRGIDHEGADTIFELRCTPP
ncbi:hypothetical protein JCM19235_1224 [Vibrio maritimus]|uniref:Uncharacterized protein n=1 Tax=Vibrio maritimus TaxID=990268 RepID=A0A090S806_9VIBR|nr:hypothetical protein JCM19235_1224 [Vibrio maritimus]